MEHTEYMETVLRKTIFVGFFHILSIPLDMTLLLFQ